MLSRLAFGDCFMLFSRERARRLGLFGTGTPHLRTAGFIGDYIAAVTGNVAIEVRERTEEQMRAAHAGLIKAEVKVPLIFIRT